MGEKWPGKFKRRVVYNDIRRADGYLCRPKSLSLRRALSFPIFTFVPTLPAGAQLFSGSNNKTQNFH
jgi:hypothetical protein